MYLELRYNVHTTYPLPHLPEPKYHIPITAATESDFRVELRQDYQTSWEALAASTGRITVSNFALIFPSIKCNNFVLNQIVFSSSPSCGVFQSSDS